MTNEYLAPFVDELFNLGVREAVFSQVHVQRL